jgi:hypothetical protein
MVASHASLQMIDSLNDWSNGTAIEPSPAWASDSGFGWYLDVLHAETPPVETPVVAPPPGVQPPAPQTPPTVDTALVSGVTAHAAVLSSAVSAGTTPATWWVEFGTTTGYGQSTGPTTIAARSPRRLVSVVLSSLSAGVSYHARVVVVSSVGRAASPDVGFTTLSDSQVPRIAAAGDIACDPNEVDFNGGLGTATACHQLGVSDAILAGDYTAVLPLGDEQYNSGTASAFAASYQPSWGGLKAISHPVVGNHEYGSPGAAPYFQYFGAAAGTPGQGWYSYDLGSWHLIALNANCAQIGGCAPGSPQELWLRADLAAHPARCTLAYWHQPLFTSGQEGSTAAISTFWADLVDAGADIVLNGHEHDYERFAPQNATGQRDDANGIPEFVVGTGGENHMTFKKTIQPNSLVRNTGTFGFLQLTLGAGAYSWRFVPDPAAGFTDSGTGTCH